MNTLKGIIPVGLVAVFLLVFGMVALAKVNQMAPALNYVNVNSSATKITINATINVTKPAVAPFFNGNGKIRQFVEPTPANSATVFTAAGASATISYTTTITPPGIFGSSWAGYSYYHPNITSISAQWRVDEMNLSGSTLGLYQWVGLDNIDVYSGGSIVQAGTSSSYFSNNNTRSYYAWYETWPEPWIRQFAVGPNDTMYARVNYLGGGIWQISIKDLNTSENFTTELEFPQNSVEADWIMEKPNSSAHSAIPAGFKPDGFSNASMVLEGRTYNLCSNLSMTNDVMANSTGVEAQGGNISDCESFAIAIK